MDMQSVGAPTASLVVATYDDEGSLATLLASWKLAADDVAELIIVDQNADDRTVVSIHQADLPHHLTPVLMRVPWQNASRARNLGATVARGSWLGFPDDDCLFPADAGRRMLEAFEAAEARGAVVVSGPIVDADGRTHMRKWPTTSRIFSMSQVDRCAIEATTFVQRDVFLRVGGFDPDFGPGGRYHAAEGNELLARLDRTYPWRGWYHRDLAFEHPRHSAAQGRDSAQRSWRYAYGAGAAWGRFPLSPLARFSVMAVVESLAALLIRRPTPWRTVERLLRASGITIGFLAATVRYGLLRRAPRERLALVEPHRQTPRPGTESRRLIAPADDAGDGSAA